MKHFIKLLLTLLPLALLAQENTVEQLFSVQSVKVKEETTAHSKKAYGYVKADEARVYAVTPRFGGYVVELFADKIYKYVKKGDALVSVYSPEVYKAKEDYLNSFNYTKNRKSKSMLKSAKLKLELLGVSNKEITGILKTKSVSQNTTIYAQKSGYIFVKNISNGSAFNAKTKLFEIVNLDEVWVEMKVYENDLAWMKEVQNFSVSFKSTNKSYISTSKLLYPKLNEKEANFTLRLRLKNADLELFPGMYATVLAQDKSQNHLTLPQTAVIRKNAKHYVFIVGDFKGEYEPKEVQVTVLNANTYIVQGGLELNDEVVNNALFMMDSDAQINALY